MTAKDAFVSPEETTTTQVSMYVVMDVFRRRVKKTHGWFLTLIEDLDEAMWSWMPTPTAPSIGWHAWHTARIADGTQAKLVTEPARWLEPGYRELMLHVPNYPNEIWEVESLADQWGLDRTQLGGYESGVGNNCSALLPGKAVILPYVRHVFLAVEQAIVTIDGQRMQSALWAEPGVTLADGEDTKDSVAENLMSHFSHTNRHLGMIEALRGAQGLQGTATI